MTLEMLEVDRDLVVVVPKETKVYTKKDLRGDKSFLADIFVTYHNEGPEALRNVARMHSRDLGLTEAALLRLMRTVEVRHPDGFNFVLNSLGIRWNNPSLVIDPYPRVEVDQYLSSRS